MMICSKTGDEEMVHERATKDYIVRPYRSGDEEEIVEFLQLVFEGWPKFDLSCTPLEHWKCARAANKININNTS